MKLFRIICWILSGIGIGINLIFIFYPIISGVYSTEYMAIQLIIVFVGMLFMMPSVIISLKEQETNKLHFISKYEE